MKNKLFGQLGDSLNANAFAVLLAAIVAFTGFFTYNAVSGIKDRRQNQREQEPPAQQEQLEETNKGQRGVPVENTPAPTAAPPQRDKPKEKTDPEATPAPVEEKKFTLPVAGGKIYNRFSGDELVYNRTLDDWRTHNGIDIYAKTGDPVNAGAAGQVKRVYEDGLLGYVAEIDHGDFVAKYCGLDKNVTVRPGDTVSRGHTIGRVAAVPMEINDESHIHLEILADGKGINPDSLL